MAKSSRIGATTTRKNIRLSTDNSNKANTLALQLIRALIHGDIFKSSAFVFACRIAGAGTTMLTHILLANTMGAEAFGIYAYALACCIVIATLVGVGLPGASFRIVGTALAEGKGEVIRTYARWGTTTILKVGALAAVTGWALVLSGLISVGSEYRPIVLVVLLTGPVLALAPWVGRLEQTHNRLARAFVPEFIGRPVLLLLVVCLLVYVVKTPLTPLQVITVQALTIFIVVALQLFLAAWFIQSAYKKTPYRPSPAKWLRLSFPFLLTTFYLNAYMELNILFAGWYLSATDLGVYSAVLRVGLLIAFGIRSVNAVLFPKVSQLYAAKKYSILQNMVTRATRLQFAGSLAAILILVVFGKSLLALFGSEFEAGYFALLVIAFSQLLVAGFGPGNLILGVTGFETDNLVVYMLTLPILFLLLSYLSPLYGPLGAACAMLAMTLVQLCITTVVTVRRTKIWPMVLTPSKSRL